MKSAISLGAWIVGVAVCVTAWAQDRGSLDDELLKGLDNELLEGLDEPAPPAAEPGPRTDPADPDAAAGRDAQPPSTVPDDDAVADPLDAALRRALGGEDLGLGDDADSPLERIERQMRVAQRRIALGRADDQTQQLQRQVVDDLAALIEQLKRQRPQPSSAGASRPSSGSQRSRVTQPGQPSASGARDADGPARDSTDRLRDNRVQRVDPESLRAMMKDTWGNLPERLREQMLQSPVDQFLPRYELMIEKYFRRLVEDESDLP